MLLSYIFRKNIRNYSDEELSRLLYEGDRRMLGELFTRYSALVYGVCLKYFKDVQLSEDIMMQLFETLPTKINTPDIKNFKGWLFTVTRNECLMVLRKKKGEAGTYRKHFIV
jgi:RNA polymerase sigma factor (sigma-70 family)